jgi:capsular exopolysaccharide synthesis family protein
MSLSLLEANVGLRPEAERDGAIDAHLVGLTKADSAEFEQYLALRRALERAQAATGLRVIAITSATINDGKTTTAINLAAALGRNPQSRVLLIDADLRKPSVAARLGLADGKRPGLAELLADPALTAADAIRHRPAFNFSVLTAGHLGDGNPYELLQSAQFGALLVETRDAYDFVVIDTPPVVPVADCQVIEAWVDGFLIVVAAHRTPRRLLAETLTILGPQKSLGLVFNRADRPFRGYYYGYGSKSRASKAL